MPACRIWGAARFELLTLTSLLALVAVFVVARKLCEATAQRLSQSTEAMFAPCLRRLPRLQALRPR